MPTLNYFIDKIATRLSMEGGVPTQLYSEQRIIMGIQHKFDVLFDEFWWPQFITDQQEFVLDGTTGHSISTVSSVIKRFSDIRHAFTPYSRAPIPRAPSNVRIDVNNQTSIMPSNVAGKIFRILPITTTDKIAVTFRTKPDNFDADGDVVDMDEQLIILGTCYDMLEDDAMNPGASDKFKNMFEARMRQITRNQHNIAYTGVPMETFPLNRWA